MQQQILIVEDNPDLAFGLRNNLEIEGYAIEVAEDGNKGLAVARSSKLDLIILDLMMPGLDGYRTLKTLRDEGNTTPVLILSARGEEADKVRGFRLGADDYVTKPFSLLELLARVEALLRRGQIPERKVSESEVYAFSDVVVDVAAQSVSKAGEPIEITHREWELLLTLLRHNGAVVSRLELLREVWGHRGAILSRTIDTHIMELRRKLEEDPSEPKHIITVRKSGYKLRR